MGTSSSSTATSISSITRIGSLGTSRLPRGADWVLALLGLLLAVAGRALITAEGHGYEENKEH
jgi:hypothetical protein